MKRSSGDKRDEMEEKTRNSVLFLLHVRVFLQGGACVAVGRILPSLGQNPHNTATTAVWLESRGLLASEGEGRPDFLGHLGRQMKTVQMRKEVKSDCSTLLGTLVSAFSPG